MTKEIASRWVLRLALFVIPCYPAEVGMPACNSANRGTLWPDQANSDRSVAKRAAQCGELQMCMQGKWKYGWRPIAINVNQLANKNAKIAGCSDVTTAAAKSAKPGA